MIEARVGAPPEPDPLMTTVRAAFGDEGFAVTRAAIEYELGGRMPMPGIEDPTLTAMAALQKLDEGFQAYVNAEYMKAEQALKTALLTVRRNPALLASDTKNLETVFRAMSALALSQKRLKNNEEKLASLHELVRAFPNRPLSRDDFGPGDIADYKEVAKSTNEKPHGQLFVDVDDPRVEVFVDGQMRGMGKVELADLVPGMYRVFVRTSSRSDPGRRYEIEVHGNNDASLKIHWGVDSRFWSVGASTSVQFANATDLSKDKAEFAAEVAGWTTRGLIAVVERIQVDGKPGLEGTLYRTDKVAVRHQRVMLDGDISAKAHELARALREGTGPSVPDASHAVASVEPREAEEHAAWREDAALGTGLALMVGGGAAYATSYYSYSGNHEGLKRGAIAAFTCGSIVLGGGFYLRGRAAGEDRLTATAFAVGVGALAAGGFWFVTAYDEQPALSHGGFAAAGAVTGAVGMAAIGAGMWLSTREHAAIPVFSAQRDSTVVGISGSF